MSKGEAFVTRKRYEHPLAGAAGHPATRAQSHRTKRRTQENGSTARGRREREPPRGERCYLPQAGLIKWGFEGRKSRVSAGPQVRRRTNERARADLERVPKAATPVARHNVGIIFSARAAF